MFLQCGSIMEDIKLEAQLTVWFRHRWPEWLLAGGTLPGFWLLPPTTSSGLGRCSWLVYNCWPFNTRWLSLQWARTGQLLRPFLRIKLCLNSAFNYSLTNIYWAITNHSTVIKKHEFQSLGARASCHLCHLCAPWPWLIMNSLSLNFLFYKRQTVIAFVW